MRSILILVIVFAFMQSNAFASLESPCADSIKYKYTSLDSLSSEDLKLLDEYKDSFSAEVMEIKAVFFQTRTKYIDTTVSRMNKSSHMEIGLDFVSRVLSIGRNTGVKGVVFYPSGTYYHKTGLYASMSMGFFTDSMISHSAKVPLLSISPGFYRTFFNLWILNIAYTRNFILYGNQFQRGLLNNSLSLYNSFDFWRYITLSVSGYISWSSNLNTRRILSNRRITYRNLTQELQQGYSANVAISLRKDFHFYNVAGAKVFTLSPELLFLFGRDNYAFLQKQFITGKNQLVDSSYRLAYDDLFGFIDLEPGLTADWRIRNLEIYASFHCAIPFNEFVEQGNVAGRITNPHHYYPYAEAGIKYLFRIRKKKGKF